jgi:hypothetical protein
VTFDTNDPSKRPSSVRRLPAEGDDAWQDPERLRTLVPRASSITVREGQKQSLSLRLSAR